MQGDINKAGAVAGVVILIVVAALVRLRSLFPDFIPQSIAACRRSFGVSIVPPMIGTRVHLAPMGDPGLPTHSHHAHHLGSSDSTTFIAYPPPAYGSHTADRQYSGHFYGYGNVGTSAGISVAIVPAPRPPSYTAEPDETQQSP